MIINREAEEMKFVKIFRLYCEKILFLTLEDARVLVKHNQWQKTMGGGKCMYSLTQDGDIYTLKRIFIHPQLKTPITLEARISAQEIEILRGESNEREGNQ